ncbi:MAG: class I SAM-dependent methyltransferase [Bacillota bacterium]
MKVQPNKEFFDEISSFYDGMIGFESALKRRQELLSRFIDKGVISAADLGCGSGLDSIALAKNGIKVAAFDQSSKMITRAGENAKKQGVSVSFYKSSLEKIPRSFNNKFELVLSLGNTLANLEPGKFQAAIGRIYALLSDNGQAVIQILNYSSILKNDNRIINITEQSENVYIRFYDFYPEHLNFNILRYKKTNLKERSLFTTVLYPYDHQDLSEAIKQAGFKSRKIYGSLNMDKYQKYQSGDLVVIARK